MQCDSMLDDAARRVQAPPLEPVDAVFNSPELLGVVALHASSNHLADVSALHRVTTTTRRNLAHVLLASRWALRLTLAPGGPRDIASNYSSIVNMRSRSMTVYNERGRDFWPSLRITFDDVPNLKFLEAPCRCTWKGPDVVRFVDWFTRLYPNRVLACFLDCLSPRAWYQADWAVMEAHPAVQLGVVLLTDDRVGFLGTAMRKRIAEAEQAVAGMGL